MRSVGCGHCRRLTRPRAAGDRLKKLARHRRVDRLVADVGQPRQEPGALGVEHGDVVAAIVSHVDLVGALGRRLRIGSERHGGLAGILRMRRCLQRRDNVGALAADRDPHSVAAARIEPLAGNRDLCPADVAPGRKAAHANNAGVVEQRRADQAADRAQGEAKRPGRGGYLTELFQGWQPTRAPGGAVIGRLWKLFRIDRGSSPKWIREKVVREDGVVTRDVDKPLDQHRHRGSHLKRARRHCRAAPSTQSGRDCVPRCASAARPCPSVILEQCGRHDPD